MDHHPDSVIYIQLKHRATVRVGRAVMLRDVAFWRARPEWSKALEALVVFRPEHRDGNLLLADMLTVIPLIRAAVPEAQVEPLGEGRTIVQLIGEKEGRKPSKALFALVWLLLFFGSALTIMNFHADVSMQEVQVRIVEMLTGRKDEHPYVFQLAYSVGIGMGMVIFFNRLFKKKWNEEPTPLEVEMFLYQRSIDQYVAHEEYGKMGLENEPDDGDGRDPWR